MLDVWVARHEGELWATFSPVGEPPQGWPVMIGTIKYLKQYIRENQVEINMVGITDPDSLGLE